MRNNFLFVATLIASMFVLNGCKQKNDVKVEDVAGSMAPAAFEKTVTRSKTVVDGLTMSVVEYTITNAEKQEMTAYSYAMGNKVNTEAAPVVYTYALQGLAENGLGFNYLFTAANGEATPVLFWGNSIVIKGDTIGDGKAPIANLKKVEASFPNHKWEFNDTTFIVRYDTLVYMDTVISSVRRPGPDGKPVVVKDTTITEKTKINERVLGPEKIVNGRYEFARDAQTFENTGLRNEVHQWFKANADESGVEKAREDSVISYTCHWGIKTMTSATRFRLNAETDKETYEVSVSNLDVDKKACTFGNDKYKLAD